MLAASAVLWVSAASVELLGRPDKKSSPIFWSSNKPSAWPTSHWPTPYSHPLLVLSSTHLEVYPHIIFRNTITHERQTEGRAGMDDTWGGTQRGGVRRTLNVSESEQFYNSNNWPVFSSLKDTEDKDSLGFCLNLFDKEKLPCLIFCLYTVSTDKKITLPGASSS